MLWGEGFTFTRKRKKYSVFVLCSHSSYLPKPFRSRHFTTDHLDSDASSFRFVHWCEKCLKKKKKQKKNQLTFVRFVCTECGGVLSAPTGTIQSPGFGYGYDINVDCLWLIQVGTSVDSTRSDRSVCVSEWSRK